MLRGGSRDIENRAACTLWLSAAWLQRAAKLQRQLGATDLARDSLLLALDLGFQEPAVFQVTPCLHCQDVQCPYT